MNATQSTTVLACGLVCVVAAIVGGGVTAAGWQFPIVNSIRRQTILGVFGLILVGISLFGRGQFPDEAKEAHHSARQTSPNPAPEITKFRDDLSVIIDDAQAGFNSTTDGNGNRLVPTLTGALRGQLCEEPKDLTADGTLYVDFACYDFDLDGKPSGTFAGLVDKVKRSVGDSWSQETRVEGKASPAPQQEVTFTSPGNRTEVDVFDSYAYSPSTRQWTHQLQVWVKDLRAKPVLRKD